MRFGGHQTFYVREGWLSKGLKMLLEDPDRFDDPYVADYLGVGRNMAKSIEHWLQATGLAENHGRRRAGSLPRLTATRLGETIWECDPYLTHSATWWFLHINLVCSPEHATTWNWFFNDYPSNRFDRSALYVSLARQERARSRKSPAQKTLERDISCFLGSYATDVPYRKKDPEEEIDCPFQDLCILRHYRASGYYEVNRRKKAVDPEVVLYALNSISLDVSGDRTDVGFHDLTRAINGPLQTLSLSSESLFEHLIELEQSSDRERVTISGLASDRQIRFPVFDRADLARLHYDRNQEPSYA